MGILTMCLGESGTGKTTSLRNFKPEDVALIQVIPKSLPFRPKGWEVLAEKHDGVLKKISDEGNIYCTDASVHICTLLQKCTRDIIVIDDFQYLMANEFMNRSDEKGFDKFTQIARHAWDVINAATLLPANKRVYILAHTQTDDDGKVKAKTVGKLLDEKITIEGMFTIVLRTDVQDGHYQFRTQNNGKDTVKSPMGLFDEQFIDNDLAAIDAAICDYYGIEQKGNTHV